MKFNNYISKSTVNLSKILDYVFRNIPPAEEAAMEDFLDANEELAAAVDALLDFCLEHNFNNITVRHLVKTEASDELMEIIDEVEACLEVAVFQENEEEIEEKIEEQVLVPTLTAETTVIQKTKKQTFKASFAKAVFTFLLVVNLPFFVSNNGAFIWQFNLLKASSKAEIRESMTLTPFEVNNMKVDILDNQSIMEHLTLVSVPSTFELRYITNN